MESMATRSGEVEKVLDIEPIDMTAAAPAERAGDAPAGPSAGGAPAGELPARPRAARGPGRRRRRVATGSREIDDAMRVVLSNVQQLVVAARAQEEELERLRRRWAAVADRLA
jgi:hypothetical protein